MVITPASGFILQLSLLLRDLEADHSNLKTVGYLLDPVMGVCLHLIKFSVLPTALTANISIKMVGRPKAW